LYAGPAEAGEKTGLTEKNVADYFPTFYSAIPEKTCINHAAGCSARSLPGPRFHDNPQAESSRNQAQLYGSKKTPETRLKPPCFQKISVSSALSCASQLSESGS
jgi:hypothetical protein